MNLEGKPSENLISSIKDFKNTCLPDKSLVNCTIQNVNLSELDLVWDEFKVENTTILGCNLALDDKMTLIRKGALILPKVKNLPYNPYRNQLYTWQELESIMENNKTTDLNIYNHFYSSRFNPGILESLWQRIHDHAVDNAMRTLIKPDGNGDFKKKIVGIMGGHGTLRNDPFYHKTAFTAKALGEKGFFIASGGGPGIMEAANLGAYFSTRTNGDLSVALKILEQAPHYTSEGYMEKALEVLNKFPSGKKSLAIPTWFYGHEPSNVFASYIAKYFSNSIREDTLLAISLHGIIYAPGSAGTTQEIFMDAAQNHYGTFGYISPMVFLGRDRYEMDTLLFPTLKQLSKGRLYQKYLFLTDDPEKAVHFIEAHPPTKL